MSKEKEFRLTAKMKVGLTVVALVVAAILGTAVAINVGEEKIEVTPGVNATLEYAEEEVPAEVYDIDAIDEVEESGRGALVDGEEIPTVESIDAGGPVTEVDNTECPEGEECGRGAYSEVLDISTPQAFANATLNRCIDVDGYYGSQCWDLAAAFFINYTGRTLNTCGTGAAKGTVENECWKTNVGDEFEMVWRARDLRPGDIAVFGSGVWGHIGMVLGYYNNGYITLLGANQGGGYCDGGGAAVNIVNISLKDFIGAFRPKMYDPLFVVPEPEPAPAAPDTGKQYVY